MDPVALRHHLQPADINSRGITGPDDDEIHVNDSPKRNFHFKSLDEALDGYIIPGTNKTLREGLFELEIVGVPVWADEDGNRL